jgi:Flp pilus assembly secretin CpaC
MSREVTRLFGIRWDNALTSAISRSAMATDKPEISRPLFGSFANNDVEQAGVIDALEREGLVSVHAEPI